MFDDWLADVIARGNWSALLNSLELAPQAKANHSTPEHFLPLFLILGAAGSKIYDYQGWELHRNYVYGAFSMATYAFSSPNFVLS